MDAQKQEITKLKAASRAASEEKKYWTCGSCGDTKCYKATTLDLHDAAVEAAWEVFGQTTFDLHDAASAGNQEAWWPGYTHSEQEMQPVEAGRSVDRTEGLLIRRIGQVENLGRVATDTGAAQAVVRKQLARKLRAGDQCPLVPPVAANVLDSWARKHLIVKGR